MGIKGSWRRPRSITRAEAELRGEYAQGEISLEKFNREYDKLKKLGLIRRSGRIIQ